MNSNDSTIKDKFVVGWSESNYAFSLFINKVQKKNRYGTLVTDSRGFPILEPIKNTETTVILIKDPDPNNYTW